MKVGEKKWITGFSDDVLAGRLLELGVLPGKVLEVVRSAPFNGAYYVKVDGHAIALRKEELVAIEVED